VGIWNGRRLPNCGTPSKQGFATGTPPRRAAELDCEVVLKATKVDGVYDSDPVTNPNARRFDRLTFTEALDRRLAVMDLTAFSMCMNNGVAIIVFDYRTPGNILSVVEGGGLGTVVRGG